MFFSIGHNLLIVRSLFDITTMNIGVTINLLSGGINGITRVHYRPRNTQTWRLQELSLNTVLKMLLGQRLSPFSFLSKLLF